MATRQTKAPTPLAKKKAPARKRGSVAPKAEPQQPAHRASGNYKRTAALSIPMVKLNAGDQYALTIQAVREQVLPGGRTKTPATLLRSVNLDTGEMMDVIATTVLVSTLSRAYGEEPGEWVGKSILIECSKRPDKRYMDVLIYEIEPK